MSIKISQLPNITASQLATVGNASLPIVANITANNVTYQTTIANVKSYVETGDLHVTGAVFANLTSQFANLIITGNLNVQGTTTTTSSQNLSTNSSIIDLHTFNSNLDPWTSDDGRDVGLRFFWYKNSSPGTSALVWENTNSYLTWYGSGVGNANTGSITGTLGTMQLGQLIVSNTTPTTANATGALQVSGGISTGGNLWVSGNILSQGSINSTSTATVSDLLVNNSANFGNAVTVGISATINSLTVNSFATIGTTLAVYGTTYTNDVIPFGNANANIGSANLQYNTVFAKATAAQYADLAEKYMADADYAPGTVVVFGGEYEITTTSTYADTRVAGVISTEPAYLMNIGSTGLPVALRGKVPVKIVGSVQKGDLLVTSTTVGHLTAVAQENYNPLAVIAKSLTSDQAEHPRTVWAVIL